MIKNMSLLDTNERLKSFSGWVVVEETQPVLKKTFEFKTFRSALLFTNAVAYLAEAIQHHPDMLIQFNRVTLTLFTHETSGITSRDFELIAQVEALPGLGKPAPEAAPGQC